MSIVVSEIPNANLFIYGSYRISSYKDELMQLIKSLELKKNITINDHIEHKDIWGYLRKYEVGVIPFRNNSLTSINTPTKLSGLGAGYASDLKWVESSARQVAKYSKGHTIIVEKSTVPVKTAELIKDILMNSESDSDFEKKTFSLLL